MPRGLAYRSAYHILGVEAPAPPCNGMEVYLERPWKERLIMRISRLTRVLSRGSGLHCPFEPLDLRPIRIQAWGGVISTAHAVARGIPSSDHKGTQRSSECAHQVDCTLETWEFFSEGLRHVRLYSIEPPINRFSLPPPLPRSIRHLRV